MQSPLQSKAGYTLIELLSAIGISATLMAVALPHIDMRREDVNTVVDLLVANTRLARSLSIAGGTHYCVHRTSSGYQVRRLKQSGNSWVLDRTVKSITLPSHVTVGPWYHFAFNTRGMQVYGDPPSTIQVTITDSFGARRQVSLWPTGQVYAGS